MGRRRLKEAEIWAIALGLPGAVFAAIACYSAAAGCYSLWMNCFSVVEPDTAVTRAMFFAAKLSPFAFPAWVPFALAGYLALYRSGAEPLRRALWVAPALFVVALHAACVLFAWTALPHRRIEPTLRFDAIALAFAYGYAALVHFALRALARWSEAHASRRWASSRS